MQSTAAEGALDFPGVKGLQVTKQGPGTSEQHKAGEESSRRDSR